MKNKIEVGDQVMIRKGKIEATVLHISPTGVVQLQYPQSAQYQDVCNLKLVSKKVKSPQKQLYTIHGGTQQYYVVGYDGSNRWLKPKDGVFNTLNYITAHKDSLHKVPPVFDCTLQTPGGGNFVLQTTQFSGVSKRYC